MKRSQRIDASGVMIHNPKETEKRGEFFGYLRIAGRHWYFQARLQRSSPHGRQYYSMAIYPVKVSRKSG